MGQRGSAARGKILKRRGGVLYQQLRRKWHFNCESFF
jgi:hypothetical protein